MGSPSEGVLPENHSVYVYRDNFCSCREKARLPQERLPPITISLLIYMCKTEAMCKTPLDLNLSS